MVQCLQACRKNSSEKQFTQIDDGANLHVQHLPQSLMGTNQGRIQDLSLGGGALM